jgi:hypothetical protein
MSDMKGENELPRRPRINKSRNGRRSKTLVTYATRDAFCHRLMCASDQGLYSVLYAVVLRDDGDGGSFF